jgi:hypothetical protein
MVLEPDCLRQRPTMKSDVWQAVVSDDVAAFAV